MGMRSGGNKESFRLIQPRTYTFSVGAGRDRKRGEERESVAIILKINFQGKKKFAACDGFKKGNYSTIF